MPVNTSVETLDEVKVKLTVEVEPTRVKQAFSAAARELAKQVAIPGFRPGKAPRRLIEQRLGAGAVAQTAMEAAISDYYVEALRAEQLNPVGRPELEVDTFDEAEGCTFTATVEIRPEVEPPDHHGITVTFPSYEVDEGDVDEQLNQLRERFAEVDPVDRAAQAGDLITLDLRVEVDGVELESAAVEEALYEVGSGGVTPRLDEEAVGKQAGDEFAYEDALPEEYPEHGGRDATFRVVVRDVREKSLPDLDDDFATTAGGFETLDELRADIRRSLLRRQVEAAQHEARGAVVEAYLARAEVPLPPSMVDAEVDQRLHELEHQAGQYGLDVEALLEAQGLTREEFEEQARTRATSAVKAQLVLDALGIALDHDLHPNEIDEEIHRHARTNRMEPEELAQVIQEQGSLPGLVGDILRRKTIDAIVAAAELEGAPSQEELEELGLAPAEAPAAAGEPRDPDETTPDETTPAADPA